MRIYVVLGCIIFLWSAAKAEERTEIECEREGRDISGFARADAMEKYFPEKLLFLLEDGEAKGETRVTFEKGYFFYDDGKWYRTHENIIYTLFETGKIQAVFAAGAGFIGTTPRFYQCSMTAKEVRALKAKSAVRRNEHSKNSADESLRVSLQEKFHKAELAGVEVSVNNSSVMLTGTVRKVSQKIEASRLSWSVPEVSELISEIEIEDIKSRDVAKDLAASAMLRAKLIGDKEINSLSFSIDVMDGQLFLTGRARSKREMKRVVEYAQSSGFVKEIVNYIIISEPNKTEEKTPEKKQKQNQDTETKNRAESSKLTLDQAKRECAEIGYSKGTEKFADCVMKFTE